ncbi:MAG TPA: hypothetical protein VJT73_06180 [Polyangiaceae bacterium]|nr:hypothetical protein [Polyangiaceae bacterium]
MIELRYLAFAATLLYVRASAAQACCAGAGAIAPARLAVHEDALLGLRLRAASVFGSFGKTGQYTAAPAGKHEWDFEQAVIGALRLLPRAQVAVVAPLVETYRRADTSEFGGGIGDFNLSARYDVVHAGESRWLPGIAALAGVTFPTGTSLESADRPLATDATGSGAFQGNAGVALERTAGPWLFGLTGLVAKRAQRTVAGMRSVLGTEWSFLAATAFTFPSDAALALLASYTLEGEAERNGRAEPGTQRRLPQVTLAGVFPLDAQWRLQAAAFVAPPISDWGQNLPATTGISLTLLRAWSRAPYCL